MAKNVFSKITEKFIANTIGETPITGVSGDRMMDVYVSCERCGNGLYPAFIKPDRFTGQVLCRSCSWCEQNL